MQPHPGRRWEGPKGLQRSAMPTVGPYDSSPKTDWLSGPGARNQTGPDPGRRETAPRQSNLASEAGSDDRIEGCRQRNKVSLAPQSMLRQEQGRALHP